METMTNCRFYNAKKGNCNALKEMYCATEEKLCCFYKPKENGEGQKK